MSFWQFQLENMSWAYCCNISALPSPPVSSCCHLLASHSATSVLCKAVIHHLTLVLCHRPRVWAVMPAWAPAASLPAVTDSHRLLSAARITAEGGCYLQVLPIITSCPFNSADTLAALIWPNVRRGFLDKHTACRGRLSAGVFKNSRTLFVACSMLDVQAKWEKWQCSRKADNIHSKERGKSSKNNLE